MSIAEKFLSTFLLMFIFYVTLFRIKLGDSAPEKEFDITMQMTPEKVLVQR